MQVDWAKVQRRTGVSLSSSIRDTAASDGLTDPCMVEKFGLDEARFFFLSFQSKSSDVTED